MKNLTYGTRSLLVGDDAADVVLRYAATLGRRHGSDSISLAAINSDGDEITAVMLVNASPALIVETSPSSYREPDNAAVIAHLETQLHTLEHVPAGRKLDPRDAASSFDEVTEG